MTSRLGFQPPVRSSPSLLARLARRAAVALRLQQVAHVPERRADHAARPEDPVDLARLPRRFDDYEVSHARRPASVIMFDARNHPVHKDRIDVNTLDHSHAVRLDRTVDLERARRDLARLIRRLRDAAGDGDPEAARHGKSEPARRRPSARRASPGVRSGRVCFGLGRLRSLTTSVRCRNPRFVLLPIPEVRGVCGQPFDARNLLVHEASFTSLTSARWTAACSGWIVDPERARRARRDLARD